MTAALSLRAAVVAVALIAMLGLTRHAPPTASDPVVLDTVPLRLASWVGQDAPPLSSDDAGILAADGYLHRYYTDPRGTIEMEVSYYRRPRVGANMHSPLNCLPGNGWRIVDSRTSRLATPIGDWPTRELLVQRDAVRYALTYWYQSRSRIVADEFAARWYVLADALRWRGSGAGLVRVMMPAARDGVEERTILADFSARFMPALASQLDE
jgi:EpsI family protein